ncbi:ChaB family protein [Aliterella atlantica]|uniref:Cation transport regulator ChaB n=1 Tax=Aliterella atlantica CENA595 TaxID=1618023 RepID=A0A0D8ZRL9_9CYAN|nr:ChaB family protein [Aliterella atlantica]KJH70997.1 cation transport regulator ChaB [Aliterella atlantica CENA595]
MAQNQPSELPIDVGQLPEHAQQIFMAAFNSAKEDGMSEKAALSVGWNSIEDSYERTSSGEWKLKPEDTNIHNKSTQSGGN